MYRTQCVLALLALCTGLAHSFPWEVATSNNTRLEFYVNGTLTHSEDFSSAKYINKIAYDPIRDRMLFVDLETDSVYSFDITTHKVQYLIHLPMYKIKPSIAYDPVTDFLFWSDYIGIYSFPLLKPASNKQFNHEWGTDLAVDSCGGFIYWISTRPSINRARFDGSEEEIIVRYNVYKSLEDLIVDLQTQKIYWVQTDNDFKTGTAKVAIQSADLNGRNMRSLYETKTKAYFANILAVAKDYIYWQHYQPYANNSNTLWQIPKNLTHDAHVIPKQISNKEFVDIAANFKIQGIENCEALKSFRPINSNHDSPNASEAPSPCIDCDRDTDRSEVSPCHNYCFKGDCSVIDGQPKCSCKLGYSGERCEVDMCRGYCLNNGVCTLNEYSPKPECHCTGDYDGERCHLPAFLVQCLQTISMLKNILNSDKLIPVPSNGPNNDEIPLSAKLLLMWAYQ